MADFNGETDLTLATDAVTGLKDFTLVDGPEMDRQQLNIDLHVVYGELEDHPDAGFRWRDILGRKGVSTLSAQQLLREYVSNLPYIKKINKLVVSISSLGGGRSKMRADLVVNDGKSQGITI